MNSLPSLPLNSLGNESVFTLNLFLYQMSLRLCGLKSKYMMVLKMFLYADKNTMNKSKTYIKQNQIKALRQACAFKYISNKPKLTYLCCHFSP